MTNVDFFRAFCTAQEYYFEHSREDLDFSNLFDGKEGFTKFMFHFSEDMVPTITGTNVVKDKKYQGAFLFLVQSSLDKPIDVQRNNPAASGKYELHVKPMIDDSDDGLIEEILEYNNCLVMPVTFQVLGVKEVYNFFDFNGDGIWVRYRMEI